MKVNFKDQNFLIEVENYTGSLLQKKEDVQKIINFVISQKKGEDFEKLTFTAKYICGLLRVINTAPGISEVNSIEHIKGDLNENIKKGVELLKQLISSGSETEKNYFEQTYFTLTTLNLTNLSSLFSDLESVKKYLNHLKRKP